MKGDRFPELRQRAIFGLGHALINTLFALQQKPTQIVGQVRRDLSGQFNRHGFVFLAVSQSQRQYRTLVRWLRKAKIARLDRNIFIFL